MYTSKTIRQFFVVAYIVLLSLFINSEIVVVVVDARSSYDSHSVVVTSSVNTNVLPENLKLLGGGGSGSGSGTGSSSGRVIPIIHKRTTNQLISTKRTPTTSTIVLSQKDAIIFGIIMVFNTGYMNGCALSGYLGGSTAIKQPSVAVTGAWTQSAIGLYTNNMDQCITNTRMILSYILGSCISSIVHPKPKPFTISKLHSSISFYISALFMLLANNFTTSMKGTTSITTTTKLVFNIIAIVSGMQNSYTSVYTSNLIRSAHMSGMTSDIGTFLGQLIRGNYDNSNKLKIFLLLVSTFWFGSFTSIYIANTIKDNCLLIPSLLYLLLGTGFLFV